MKYLITLQTICILIFAFLVTDTWAAGQVYGNCVYSCKNRGSTYTIEQQQRRGDRDSPKYTTCRLKTQKRAKTGKMLCVYEGANQTYETQIGDVSGGCPTSYQCIYNPGSKMINIDDVLDSLNDAVK